MTSEITDLPWLNYARSYVGVREIKGVVHNPLVVGFWKMARLAGIKNDEVPWCAGFVGAALESRAYLDWGEKIGAPEYGCVVVFSRAGGGHVGFCVGVDNRKRLMILGGNQGDAVSIAPFDRNRVVGYRRVPFVAFPRSLPVLAGDGASSSNEA